MHESSRLTDQELQCLMDQYSLRRASDGGRVWSYDYDKLMRALHELEDRRAADLNTGSRDAT